MADEQRRSGIGGIGDGIRTGIGILSAFKDAVEQTLEEAVKRGDLSPERARDAMRDAASRAQTVFEDAREKLDLVPRPEFDALRKELDDQRSLVVQLRDEIARLRESVDRLEARDAGNGGPAIDLSE